MSKPKINTEMIGALDYLEKEKGIKKEIVIEALEQALESAYKQNYGDKNVEVEFNSLTGNIKVYAVKTITDDEEAVEADSNEFMSLADARMVKVMILAMKFAKKLLHVILVGLLPKLLNKW